MQQCAKCASPLDTAAEDIHTVYKSPRSIMASSETFRAEDNGNVFYFYNHITYMSDVDIMVRSRPTSRLHDKTKKQQLLLALPKQPDGESGLQGCSSQKAVYRKAASTRIRVRNEVFDRMLPECRELRR